MSTVVPDSITWAAPSQYRNKLVTPWLPSGSVSLGLSLSPITTLSLALPQYDIHYEGGEEVIREVRIIHFSYQELSLYRSQGSWFHAKKTRNKLRIVRNC